MDFLNLFSNREIALFLWVFIIIIFLSLNKPIRKSFRPVLKAFFSKRILIAVLCLLLYVSAIVFALHCIRYWDISILKDTIFWTFGFAFVLMFRMNDIKRFKDFRIVLKVALKWTLVVEFIVAFYSFPLALEIIIFPIILFIGLMQVYSEAYTEHQQVNRILLNILSVIGFVIFCCSAYMTFFNSETLFSIQNGKVFLLPIILTMLFLPFIYLLSLYDMYAVLFVRLRIFIKDDSIRRKVKRRVLMVANVNIERLSNISQRVIHERPFTEDNLREKIKAISKSNFDGSL